MRIYRIGESAEPAWVVFVVLTIVTLGGCAANSIEMATIAPENAGTTLAAGDEIHIVRKDNSFVPLIVDEVNESEIVGDEIRVSLDDIEYITLMGEAREGSAFSRNMENATYLLILLPFFFL